MGQMLGRLYKKRHIIQSPADLRLMRQQQAETTGSYKQEQQDSSGEEDRATIKKPSKLKRGGGRRSFVDTSRLVYLDLQTKNTAQFSSLSNLEETKEISKSDDAIPVKTEAEKDVTPVTHESMDVQYITEHVLLFHVPHDTPEHVYQQQVTNVADMMRSKHADNYVVLNLCCRGRKMVSACNSRVEEFGWPAGLAPSLEKLCAVCKSMEHWLRLQCVVVLHSRGELDRIGVVMSAYLKYSSTFEASESSDQQTLDRFAMSRFLSDRIGPLHHPSQKRYIDYFGGLLSGAIEVNTNSVSLHHITVEPVPQFHSRGGCTAFVKIYQKMLPVFTSPVFRVHRQAKHFIIPIGDAQGIQLRGDILIKCYHRHSDKQSRKVIFRCQFHTCAIYTETLHVNRHDLDDACYDPRFPVDGVVRFHFVRCKDSVPGFDVDVEDASEDPIVKWDSYDTLANEEAERESPLCHLQGPLDGSLYATVTKQTKTKCSSLETGPHTASMDSGISSHSGVKDGRGSASPPGQPNSIETKVEVHPHPNHTELDELVSGMLLDIQNIPDLKPIHTNLDDIKVNFDFSSVSSGYPPSLATPLTNGHDSVFDDEPDIPYHARQDSKPFSYGISNTTSLPRKNSGNLESPTAVRKASGHRTTISSSISTTTQETPKKTGLESPKLIRKFSSEKKPNGYLPSSGDESSSSSYLITKRIEDSYTPHKRSILDHSYTTPSLYRRTDDIRNTSLEDSIRELRIKRLNTSNTVSTGSDAINQSWLQKQQAKLRERQELQKREGSPMKNGGLSSPLHINTSNYSTLKQSSPQEGKPNSEPTSPVLPVRSSSRDKAKGYQQFSYATTSHQHRPLGRNHSDTLYDRERPYVSFRREQQMFAAPSDSSTIESDRPVTPGFPVTPSPGLPPKSPTTQRKDRSPSPGLLNSSIYYPASSKRNSNQSLNDSGEVITHHPRFVKDVSKFWYKPSISRDEAIAMLKDRAPGTFVVRDSNSFPGAYGLALKVSQPPANIPSRGGDTSNELVRHFLIEPTNRGVRLKGCSDEPVFGSLSALVYQHSITAMALPTVLVLPDNDPSIDGSSTPSSSTTAQLLARGAACNLLYLYTMDIESLSGSPAIKKAMSAALSEAPRLSATVVHFNVSDKGITITDNERKLFFRRHYPLCNISHCGVDPEDRRWTQINKDTGQPVSSHRVFGFVAKKPPSKTENQCHLFAEYEEGQPTTAIVRFVNKAFETSKSPI